MSVHHTSNNFLKEITTEERRDVIFKNIRMEDYFGIIQRCQVLKTRMFKKFTYYANYLDKTEIVSIDRKQIIYK